MAVVGAHTASERRRASKWLCFTSSDDYPSRNVPTDSAEEAKKNEWLRQQFLGK